MWNDHWNSIFLSHLSFSTCIAGAIANKLGITWNTKEGEKTANYWGSLMMASTVKLGNDAKGNAVFTPIKNMLPMVDPSQVVYGRSESGGMGRMGYQQNESR